MNDETANLKEQKERAYMLEINNTKINDVIEKRPIVQICSSIDPTLCLYVSKVVSTMYVYLNAWVIIFGPRSFSI